MLCRLCVSQDRLGCALVTKDSKVSVAYKDLFLAHIAHSLGPFCSCDLTVLPLEPRMMEKHLSGTWPVIVAEEKKDTQQAICCLLKLLPRSGAFQATFYRSEEVTWPLLS